MPHLNVAKEPADAIFIDVLDDGEVVCVSRARGVGTRDFAFIDHAVVPPDRRRQVEGWVDFKSMRQVPATELAALRSASPAGASPAPASPAPPAGDVLRFSEPIPFGAVPVVGSSIEQLATGVPLFPPFEGLEDSVWKKNCGACHKWDRAALCQQGGTYAKHPRFALRHPHPYGGAYKSALMQWAKTGCL